MSLTRRIRFQWRYFWSPPWDTGISPPELIDFIEKHPPGWVLDLGCGTGTNAITLARYGWQVTAVDFAWRAIKIARRKTRQAGLEIDFRVGDVLKLNHLSGLFDLILDIGCYHSLPDEGKQTYVKNLERFLAPEGTFLMYGFFRAPGESKPGMSEEDVERISDRLKQINRVDSLDNGMRPSVWLTYQRPQGEDVTDLSNVTMPGDRKS